MGIMEYSDTLKYKSIKDVDPHHFVTALASHFKKQRKIKEPHELAQSKTSSSKELSPYDEDWWFERVASVARRLYFHQGSGVGRLRNLYGSICRRGTRPRIHCRASGKIIRKCLRQLEDIKILEKEDGKGRRMTESGRKKLELIAR